LGQRDGLIRGSRDARNLEAGAAQGRFGLDRDKMIVFDDQHLHIPDRTAASGKRAVLFPCAMEVGKTVTYLA
jgi:hypothetical protein